MKFYIKILSLALIAGANYAGAQTNFGKGTDEYGVFFNSLKKQLTETEYRKTVYFGGKKRNQFVQWIRDNVHVMKAMKYLESDISSFWEFFMENQTSEGLFFDYYYPVTERVNHRMNLFDKRYWKIISKDSIQMHRLPVEADLEYLMVEGAYYIWQATGDDAYISKWLAKLEKGLEYIMTDPLRWSKKYKLAKRGYTLDTWDFMQLPMSRAEYVKQGFDVQNGIFNIDEKTPMGIMHGDNSGLFAACNQLSAMFLATGNNGKADFWREQAITIRMRTNDVCWNGNFFSHFVEVDPSPAYLIIDHKNTLSLSNPYDINRGLPTEAMAQSIIGTYKKLKEKNIENSFAEWFGVYPPVQPSFADYLPGSYMNGGVNTIVGGELAKAAFQHGYEEYGVDILKRMIDLNEKHGNKLPVSYKPDGTVDEGIPDNWGQAAVFSAMIEGLAGVVDKGKDFETAEISPRWLAAGKNEAVINIAYGNSGKHIGYTFQHDLARKKISLVIEGDAKKYTIRQLMPVRKIVTRVQLDNKNVSFKAEKIGAGNYISIQNIAQGSHTITINYK